MASYYEAYCRGTMPVLKSLEEIQSHPFSAMEPPQKVLLVRPDYFSIEYAINPHMRPNEGTIGNVDEKRALYQWEKLKEKCSELGLKVFTIPGQENLPDMVFAANQVLPFDSKNFLIGKMAHQQRAPEVSYIKDFFEHRGYHALELPENVEKFEGTGDALWHFGMDLLWCGHGFRTDTQAIEHLGNDLNIAVVPLELTNEYFYHLDTCMCILNSNTVAWVPKAFSEESAELIDKFFPKTIEIPLEEAKEFFSCNSWSPDGKNVLVPTGSKTLKAKLEAHNFIIHELDTSEFIKAGGSIFCMKLAFF